MPEIREELRDCLGHTLRDPVYYEQFREWRDFRFAELDKLIEREPRAPRLSGFERVRERAEQMRAKYGTQARHYVRKAVERERGWARRAEVG